jgi:predicted methyltransferase
MGDDDFTSIAVSHLYLGVYPLERSLVAKSITIIDIDARILQKIEELFKQDQLPLKTLIFDYRNPVPKEFEGKFETIIVDPPYSHNGLILTLSRAIDFLVPRIGAEIYLSYAHRSPNEINILQKSICEMGLAINEIIPRFNFYEGCDILGNTTQMMRLLRTDHSHSLIPKDQNYTQSIYTGEICPTLRYYYCQTCQQLIEISSLREIHTIEQLKIQGCPYCNSHGPFELEEKIVSRN